MIVAVKLPLLAEQTVVVPDIAMVGVTGVLTVIVMLFEVAVGRVTQVSDVVITQLTTSPLFNALLVNVLPAVDTVIPFTFHA